jgi:hypothetical protein
MGLEVTMANSQICEQRLCNVRRPRELSHPPGGSEGEWLGGRRATNRSAPHRHSPLWRSGPEFCATAVGAMRVNEKRRTRATMGGYGHAGPPMLQARSRVWTEWANRRRGGCAESSI